MAFTKDIGIRDFYKLYVDNSIKKGKPYKDYITYSKILKLANLKIREKIIYNSNTFTLPFRGGDLYVHKFVNQYTDENKKVWRVDFKKTKETGEVTYFGSKYGYRWKWNKRNCIINGKRWYTFKPCRTASRLIADAVKNKQIDFYN